MGLFKNVKDKLISIYEGEEDEWADNDDYITKLTAGLLKKDEQDEYEYEDDEEIDEYQEEYVEREPEIANDIDIHSFTSTNFKYEDMLQFVHGQCEIMETAIHNIDRVMDDYNEVTEEFADIELYEDAPENLKNQVAYYAEYVDSLSVDRKRITNSEKKLSNKAYQRMDRYRDEIPNSIKIMEQQESYFESVKRDLNLLEGEKMALRLEGKELKQKQKYIRKYSIYLIISFAIIYGIFVLVVIANNDSFNMMLFLLVTILGACVAVGIFAYLKSTQRRVLRTEVKINKATALLNKVKVKYVNAANLLEYDYKRYRVNSVQELQKKYKLYLEMKEEQQRVFKMTTHLSKAEADLIKALERVGMTHPNIWVGQVRPLYDKKEMVEVRHQLARKRQEIRNSIAHNEERISVVKSNIKMITDKYPEYVNDVLNILEDFEQRN